MQKLREIDGDNDRLQKPLPKERLTEVVDNGKSTHMTADQIAALKERQDIRIAEQEDKVTVLHRLR